ncbi:hypothetical protein G9A89_017802 [Geosiphon pyriformis]|nr:hypothetical protein G9A89_017802 [Geosiphon pyriformis]
MQVGVFNLEVNWIKVRGHLGIPDNEHADALAKKTASSAWRLPHLVGERFLKAGGTAVSGNSKHFVRDVFCSVHCACSEVGSGSWVVADVCLYCGDVEISDHVFFCSHDTTGRAQLLDIYASAWAALFVFKDSEVGASKIVDFVHEFCLAFWDNIWLVHTRHRVFMKKHSLILCDGSASALVSGLSMVFSVGVVRLLDSVDASAGGFDLDLAGITHRI